MRPIRAIACAAVTAFVAVIIVRDAPATVYCFHVSGTVDYQFKTEANYKVLKKATVEVWDEDFGADQLLALTYTNDSGEYNADVQSDDDGGPDVYVKVILEDYFGSVEVEDGGDEEYLETNTYDDQTSDITIDVWFSSATGRNDEAHLYQVLYDALKATDFGTKTMEQVHATRSGVEDDASFFETTGLAEIHVGTNHVWYANNDPAYGNWSVCHELGHAVMWAMRGHSWPALGAAPDPHSMNQEAGRGFAWVEGWAHIYASARDGVPEGTSNWNFNDPDSTGRCGSPYWAGGVNSDGTHESPVTGADNSGLGVEGAIGSAGYLIGFDAIWPVVRENGNTIDRFEDVWDQLTRAQAQREAVERNNMIFSRGRLTEFRCDTSEWSEFVDGTAFPPSPVISFRAQENTETSLNLDTGEGDTVTAMRFSYRSVTSLTDHTVWFPHNSGWTEIGTDTSKTGGNWEVAGWTPPASGDYWIRVQTIHGTGGVTTRDTILPGDSTGAVHTAMRAWTRNTLHAVLDLYVYFPMAGDPSFVQPDRRKLGDLAQARADRRRKLEEARRKRALDSMLAALEARLSRAR